MGRVKLRMQVQVDDYLRLLATKSSRLLFRHDILGFLSLERPLPAAWETDLFYFSIPKSDKTIQNLVWSSKLQHRSFTQLKSHTTDRRMETHNPPPHIGSGWFRKGYTTRIGMSAQNDWLNPEDWRPMPIRASGQAWCSSMSWRIRDIWQMSPHPFRLAKRQTVGLEWIRFFITFWVWGVAKATAKWQTVYWWQYFQSSEVQPALEDWRIPRPPCNLCQGAWGWGRCHLCKWSKHSSHTTTVLGKILFSSILCWYPLIFVRYYFSSFYAAASHIDLQWLLAAKNVDRGRWQIQGFLKLRNVTTPVGYATIPQHFAPNDTK